MVLTLCSFRPDWRTLCRSAVCFYQNLFLLRVYNATGSALPSQLIRTVSASGRAMWTSSVLRAAAKRKLDQCATTACTRADCEDVPVAMLSVWGGEPTLIADLGKIPGPQSSVQSAFAHNGQFAQKFKTSFDRKSQGRLTRAGGFPP